MTELHLRSVRDRSPVMHAVAVIAILALLPYAWMIGQLLVGGLQHVTWSFLTEAPQKSGRAGGILPIIVSTLSILAVALVAVVPVGLATAIVLCELSRRHAALGRGIGLSLDVLAGVPSIVFGLFIYIVLVLTKVGGTSFAGYKGSLALALLMLPVVARSAEVVLLLVPDSLREAALALGAPRWKVTMRIVFPTALPGLITGAMLAVARAAGETAPLLFTAAIALGTSFDINQRMNSLPAQIFADVSSPNDALVQRAWGAALTLVAMVFILTLIARLAQRRSRLT